MRFAAVLALIITLLVALTAPAAAASMMVRNAQNQSSCLKTSSGSDAYTGSCVDELVARWVFQPNSHTANSYYLVNASGAVNMCLEQDPTPNAATVRLGWCNGGYHQSWHISYVGPANVYINNNTGDCLKQIGTSRTVGAFDCDHTLNGQWRNG